MIKRSPYSQLVNDKTIFMGIKISQIIPHSHARPNPRLVVERRSHTLGLRKFTFNPLGWVLFLLVRWRNSPWYARWNTLLSELLDLIKQNYLSVLPPRPYIPHSPKSKSRSPPRTNHPQIMQHKTWKPKNAVLIWCESEQAGQSLWAQLESLP